MIYGNVLQYQNCRINRIFQHHPKEFYTSSTYVDGMASKTISLTNEVYQLLKRLKLPNESFGDVIKRLCNEKSSSDLSIWIKDKVLWSDMKNDEFNAFKIALDDMKYSMEEVQYS